MECVDLLGRGHTDRRQVKLAYVKAAVRWDNPLPTAKYVLREILKKSPIGLEGPEGKGIQHSRSVGELEALYARLYLGASGDGGASATVRAMDEATSSKHMAPESEESTEAFYKRQKLEIDQQDAA